MSQSDAIHSAEWVVDRLEAPIQNIVFYTVDEDGEIDNEYSFSGSPVTLPRVGEEVSVSSVRDEEDGSYINEGKYSTEWEERTVMRGVVEKISHDYEERGSCPKNFKRRHFVFVKVRETDDLDCSYV